MPSPFRGGRLQLYHPLHSVCWNVLLGQEASAALGVRTKKTTESAYGIAADGSNNHIIGSSPACDHGAVGLRDLLSDPLQRKRRLRRADKILLCIHGTMNCTSKAHTCVHQNHPACWPVEPYPQFPFDTLNLLRLRLSSISPGGTPGRGCH
jgi:hypothetical protein